MPLHVHKKAIRALGISESFTKGISVRSILAGVVMRTDLLIDGFAFSTVEVGGMDATERIQEMYASLDREDINDVYIRFVGMTLDEARSILKKFTSHGAVPEPLRVARLLARSIMKNVYLKSR